MKVQNNICEGSLITNYLPADYCDSFSKTIVSDKSGYSRSIDDSTSSLFVLSIKRSCVPF